MRICWLGSFGPAGGGYASPSDLLAQRFAADGHVVRVSSRERRRVAKGADMLAALSERHDALLVDVYSSAAIWYARAALGMGRAFHKVAVLHGGRLPELARRRPKALRRLLARATHLVAPSPYLAREVGERLGLEVQVIPNPIELARYPRRVRTEARPRLFWLRAFHEVYRPEVAVHVLAELRREHPEARLVMAGPDRDGSLGRCRELARRLRVDSALELPGAVGKDQLRALGDAADVFLNTAAVDNAPVSVCEAMAMGLCVVTTSAGGIPDLVTDGADALTVPVDNPAAMAAAVGRVLREPAVCRGLSERAIASAERFELERVIPAWYRILTR